MNFLPRALFTKKCVTFFCRQERLRELSSFDRQPCSSTFNVCWNFFLCCVLQHGELENGFSKVLNLHTGHLSLALLQGHFLLLPLWYFSPNLCLILNTLSSTQSLCKFKLMTNLTFNTSICITSVSYKRHCLTSSRFQVQFSNMRSGSLEAIDAKCIFYLLSSIC